MHVLSIKPEVILYVYMASCIAVLVFNILYIFIDKYIASLNIKTHSSHNKRKTTHANSTYSYKMYNFSFC